VKAPFILIWEFFGHTYIHNFCSYFLGFSIIHDFFGFLYLSLFLSELTFSFFFSFSSFFRVYFQACFRVFLRGLFKVSFKFFFRVFFNVPRFLFLGMPPQTWVISIALPQVPTRKCFKRYACNIKWCFWLQLQALAYWSYSLPIN